MTISRNFCLALVLALLGWLLIGCNTEIIVQKDPTQAATVGDYKITGTVSYTINGIMSSSAISGTLTVFAGESPEACYFLEKLTGFNQLGYLATFAGQNFIVGTAQESTKYQSTTYYGMQNGNGKMSPNRIEVDRYANTNSVGLTSPAGEHIGFYMAIRKHVHIVATKQL
ncbi:hypothetical protein [Spirosoma flavum]|uniref:Uncharacterized protein n=1 Tax=Spirosoma flavum TaxID=2048557 RepID=A0ABW6AG50_9BACT